MKKMILGIYLMAVGQMVVNASERYLRTAKKNQRLIKAVRQGNYQKVERALQDGANPNGVTFGHPVLELAVELGHDQIVEKLIQAGANVNKIGGLRYTNLMLAASIGNNSVVAILIKAKADLNVQNFFGDTALSSAVRNRQDRAVKMLLAAGASTIAPSLNYNDKTFFVQRVDKIKKEMDTEVALICFLFMQNRTNGLVQSVLLNMLGISNPSNNKRKRHANDDFC